MDEYDIPSNSLKSKEEDNKPKQPAERPAIVPRKKGVGSFFRAMVNKGDVDSVTNIFANAMINAVGDTIDEVTGNLTHRAKTILYGTENYDRGRNGRRDSRDQYNSYSKYYEERNGRSNKPTGSSGIKNSQNNNDDSSSKKWKYNDVFFSNKIFGKKGAEMAAWRVIQGMDEIISDPDTECVTVGDFFRLCLDEDPQNPMLSPEFTDERRGWDDENIIARLQPVAIPGGYIIELPKPKSLYN